MAFTQAQVDALKDAIASGALEVEHNGKKVRYRSLSEMEATLKKMEESLGTRRKVNRLNLYSDKGLG